MSKLFITITGTNKTTDLAVIGGIICGIGSVVVLILITYFVVMNVRGKESPIIMQTNTKALKRPDTKLYSMDGQEKLKWLQT